MTGRSTTFDNYSVKTVSCFSSVPLPNNGILETHSALVFEFINLWNGLY